MTHISSFQSQLQVSVKGIEATLKLLSEDCTIPFIARYRKDQAGGIWIKCKLKHKDNFRLNCNKR